MIFGWAIPGLFGAKDMSGYWSAGRGAICCAWPSDWPSHWPSDWPSERIFVPPISFFKIDHIALLAKGMSMVGAILQKMAVFLKENALTPNFFHFTIGKVISGRFSNRKWAKRPPNRRRRVHFVFENRSLVDFQIGHEQKCCQIEGYGCISYLKIYHWSIFK